MINVTEIHLDENLDLNVEVSNQYATINNVIDTLVNQIKLIKGL